MSSAITQTPITLFQNMLLFISWIQQSILPYPKEVVNETQPYSSQPHQNFKVKHTKETQGKGRKEGTWTNELAVLQLGMQKSFSASPYKTY